MKPVNSMLLKNKEKLTENTQTFLKALHSCDIRVDVRKVVLLSL